MQIAAAGAIEAEGKLAWVRITAAVGKPAESRQGITVGVEAEERMGTQEGIRCQGSAACLVRTESQMTKRRYLDGSRKLDEKWKLNGGTYVL